MVSIEFHTVVSKGPKMRVEVGAEERTVVVSTTWSMVEERTFAQFGYNFMSNFL